MRRAVRAALSSSVLRRVAGGDGTHAPMLPPPRRRRHGAAPSPRIMPAACPESDRPGVVPRSHPMSATALREVLRAQLDDLLAKGLYTRERQLQTPQGASVRVGGREVINFCANNYLGLVNHPALV